MSKFLRSMDIIKNERGAIAIEAPFIFFLILMMIFFTLDLSVLILNKGKVERVAHSVSSILRERTYLYDENKQLTNAEIEDMATVARRLLSNTFPGKTVEMHIDATYFLESDNGTVTIDNVEHVMTSENSDGSISTSVIAPLSFSYATNASCKPTSPLTDTQLFDLTLESLRSFWGKVPIYHITLCVNRDDMNFFTNFVALNIPAANRIVVSSVVMPR